MIATSFTSIPKILKSNKLAKSEKNKVKVGDDSKKSFMAEVSLIVKMRLMTIRLVITKLVVIRF